MRSDMKRPIGMTAWLLVAHTTLAATNPPVSMLIKESVACAVRDKYLGDHCSIDDCASACDTEPGCWFFSLGKGELKKCRCWAKVGQGRPRDLASSFLLPCCDLSSSQGSTFEP